MVGAWNMHTLLVNRSYYKEIKFSSYEAVFCSNSSSYDWKYKICGRLRAALFPGNYNNGN